MFCSGQRGLAWCEAISWCVVFAQFSTPAMLLKEHAVCGLKAPLFSCTSPLIEQNYLWLLIFKQHGGSFRGFSWIYMMHLLKVFLPNYNCPLSDLKWKSYSREYTMKRCGLPYFEGGGVLNVTTVSLCDNMEILTFLWFGIQSVRVTDRARLKISPTECSWILYITTTVNILWLFIGGQQLNNCICRRHLSDFKAN